MLFLYKIANYKFKTSRRVMLFNKIRNPKLPFTFLSL